MTSPDPAALSTVPLFDGISAGDLQRLAGWFEVENLQGGRKFTKENRAGYAFHVLGSGSVRIEHEGQVIARLNAGDVFGEMAFFEPDGKRTADVVTAEDCVVYTMFGTAFREMQLEIPEIAARVEKLYHERSGH